MNLPYVRTMNFNYRKLLVHIVTTVYNTHCYTEAVLVTVEEITSHIVAEQAFAPKLDRYIQRMRKHELNQFEQNRI